MKQRQREVQKHNKKEAIAARQEKTSTEPQQEHKSKEPPPPTTLPPPKFRLQLWPVVKIARGVPLALLTLIGLAYQFRPQILVERDITLNPSDPFSTQFRITNTGVVFPVHNVRVSCTLNSPMFTNVTFSKGSASVLRAQDSMTTDCGLRADHYPYLTGLELSVSFQLPILKWSLRTAKHLINMRDSEGTLHWVQQPETKE